ncbi:MAG: phosphatidate cytidylyltransferase [Clostridia bacterium]|nr:phosphatidate cytidylyltransferase [Clostridia bacterium]
MKQRIITGAVLVLLLLIFIFLSGTIVYPLIITLLAVAGTYEMMECIDVKNVPYITIPSLVFSALCTFIASRYRYGVLSAFVVCYLFVMLFMLVFAHDKVDPVSASAAFMFTTYITICFTCLVKLRYVTTDPGSNTGDPIGQYVYLLVFAGAWVTDTFAYFTGYLFGKHKLCPNISPKKTVEGALGGVVFCVIAYLIYGFVLSKMLPVVPNYIGIAIVAVVVSFLSQTGDLLASVIKRKYGIKDYGKIFPGHGGVLDRFDSILLVSPFLLLLVEDAQYLSALVKVIQ